MPKNERVKNKADVLIKSNLHYPNFSKLISTLILNQYEKEISKENQDENIR